MKQLLTSLMLICSFALVGCGGGGASPGETVEQFARAMEAGDVDKVKELCPDFEDNLGDAKIETLVKKGAKETEEEGGIKSIVIDKEEINGDTATVTATMTSGSGESKADDYKLKKVEGKWVIDMGEDLAKLGGGGGPTIDLSGDDEAFPSDFEVPEGFDLPESE